MSEKTINILSPSRDPHYLLDRERVEAIPGIVALKASLAGMLPPRIRVMRTSLSPLQGLPSVLRADCTNSNCSVRATIRIQNDSGTWSFAEEGPRYERFQNACDECKSLK